MANHKINLVIATILFLMMIGFAKADVSITYPIPSTVSLNTNNQNQIVEFQNMNSSQTAVISLSLSPEVTPYVTLSTTSLSIAYRNSVTLSLKFTNSSTGGTFNGFLNFNDGTDKSIPILVTIQKIEENTASESGIIVFPTSKIISVQQGTEKTQNILVSVPSSYPRTVTINAVNFNPGAETISFGDLNLGQVPPGNTINIPIVFSATNAQTGTYMTDLSILATDSLGQVTLPKVNLVMQVTTGVTPVTTDTFSTPPTCSLSATNLNLNSTYSFTCSNAVSNIDIEPQYNDFFRGQKVEVSSGLYRYDFVPLKFGETTFKAIFKYKGAPIFDAYQSTVTVTSDGSVIPGTVLSFYFTPKLENAKSNEAILIQLVNNGTGSLVPNPRVFVNAVELNTTTGTFQYQFQSDTDFELRGKSVGYNDVVKTVRITPKELDLIIYPSSGDSSTIFNISSSVSNVTISVRGSTYSNSYSGALFAGVHEIKASKDGYTTKSINITVDDIPRVLFGGNDFKTNVEQLISLNKNVSWTLFYKPKLETADSDRTILNVGNGNLIKFTPKKNGIYQVAVGDNVISTFQTKSFSFSDKWWFLPAWGWFIIFGIIILLILFVVFLKKTAPHGSSGLTYQVGEGS